MSQTLDKPLSVTESCDSAVVSRRRLGTNVERRARLCSAARCLCADHSRSSCVCSAAAVDALHCTQTIQIRSSSIRPNGFPDPLVWTNFYEGWTAYSELQPHDDQLADHHLHNVIANLVSCSLAAYGFARLRAPGKNFLFALVLATMLLPNEVTIIPAIRPLHASWAGTTPGDR